jgi:hypothetical protein
VRASRIAPPSNNQSISREYSKYSSENLDGYALRASQEHTQRAAFLALQSSFALPLCVENSRLGQVAHHPPLPPVPGAQ